jgi:hypothetical protein
MRHVSSFSSIPLPSPPTVSFPAPCLLSLAFITAFYFLQFPLVLTILDSTFLFCACSDTGADYGGAFGLRYTTRSTVHWRYCVFVSCSARYGGAIRAYSSGSYTVTNCVFYKNTAKATRGFGFFRVFLGFSVFGSV